MVLTLFATNVLRDEADPRIQVRTIEESVQAYKTSMDNPKSDRTVWTRRDNRSAAISSNQGTVNGFNGATLALEVTREMDTDEST